MRKRRAFSLVELVIGMTCGAIVFALAIRTVEQTMKLSNDSSARSQHQMTLARLQNHLRNDVHDASAAQLSKDDASPQLTLQYGAARSIRYNVEGSTVTRISSDDEANVIERETYRLAKECRVRFEASEKMRVKMSVTRQTLAGEMLESRLAARVNRLASLQNTQKGE